MHSIIHPASLLTACLCALFSAQARATPEFTQIDPAVLSFAIAVPDEVHLETGDASFMLIYKSEAVTVTERFAPLLAPSPALQNATDHSGTVYIGNLSATDQQRLRQAQKAIANAEQNANGGTGEAELTVTGGCYAGPAPKALPISTWVQIDAKEGYQEVIRNQDLLTVLDAQTRDHLMRNLRSCGQPLKVD